MKKFILIALAALIGTSALAQDGKSIYNKYSEAEGVSAVYISPAMFKLMKKIPDIDLEGESVNLGPIIKTLTGMYIISSENPAINDDIKKDVDRFIKRGTYDRTDRSFLRRLLREFRRSRRPMCRRSMRRSA